MDFDTLKLELQKRSLDLGQTRRPDTRYGEVLNEAAQLYPRDLWPTAIDGTTLDTVADTTTYALGSVSNLTQAHQVRRIWIDDSDGEPRQVGRFEIQDNAGTLSLVLDTAPDGAYDITIEYHTPPTAMSGGSDTTAVDDAWLLDRSMVILLLERDPNISDPQYVLTQLDYYRGQVAERERQLMGRRRRTSRRARTTRWRRYVG